MKKITGKQANISRMRRYVLMGLMLFLERILL